jgi:hypothetical protein
MPCYLFTYHGHGTWLPDNARGYVRRKQGVLATDKQMADCYRRNFSGEEVGFDRQSQQTLIDAAVEAFRCQTMRGHAIATETTHLHLLASWTTNRTWQVVRRQLRESLTRRLNLEVERRRWFSKQPSRKQVKDQSHFDYLVQSYLPKHSGLKWCKHRGVYC